MEKYIGYYYLVSALCFIYALRGLSAPASARNGNNVAIIGMLIALIACMLPASFHHKMLVLTTMALGGGLGAFIAMRIPMTSLPELMAGFHSLVGLAAVFVAYSALISPESFKMGIEGHLPFGNLIEMSIGASIGAITFSGSIIAFAKLKELMPARAIKFPGQQYVCILVFILIVILVGVFSKTQSLFIFNSLVLLSLILGLLIIVPVGGADMPVVISMLNSYSGWASAGIGFTLSNNLLVITGAIVGASGAILSYIMCQAMNRSLVKVIFGAFLTQNIQSKASSEEKKPVNISSPDDAAFMLKNSSNVIIVPGYGMAVAQAQHAVRELTEILKKNRVEVRFAIHPVAGRMPGHMNVLLAEANIPYESVFELEDINRDFSSTDIVIVIGANDITNTAAKTDPNSPIYGMPILDVEYAKTVYFIKRSMASGYAGIENELFYKPNTLMLFGDAKKVVESIIKSFETL